MIPTGNPIDEGAGRPPGHVARRWTIATQSPAIGPNSGPTIIAPTIRIGESRKMPTDAIRQAAP